MNANFTVFVYTFTISILKGQMVCFPLVLLVVKKSINEALSENIFLLICVVFSQKCHKLYFVSHFKANVTPISPKAAGAAPEGSGPHNTGLIRLQFTALCCQYRKQRDGPLHPGQW